MRDAGYPDDAAHRAEHVELADQAKELARRLQARQGDVPVATLTAAGAGTLTNPYPPGTQEYVLWIATYHLRLTELAEEQEEQGTVRVTKAPDYPSLSRP